jgi:AraC-like DNA-binding protein
VNELRTFVTYLLFLCGEVYYLCFYSLHLRRTKEQYLMKEVIKLDTVDQYNRLFGLETLHPLVSVVNLSEATRFPTHFTMNYGVYALFLKNVKCGDIRYGRQIYDYQEGTVTSFAPGQVVEVDMLQGVRPNAYGLLFHPDLIKGTSLGQDIKHYSFFSYASAEALHLSEEEKSIFTDCLEKIRMELQHPIDKHSKRLISRNIELLLDYCMRFYERQFITRSESNKSVLVKFEALLDDYFQSDKPQTDGLPSVKYFADKVFLSPNYFGDLIKKETGKSAQEYIQTRMIDIAKEMIAGTEKTVSQIAYELGFQYSQHFNRIFKKNTGYTPGEYRKLQI